ncbi:MAG: hypothetical protein ACRC41_06715 [Sarcina sp.]
MFVKINNIDFTTISSSVISLSFYSNKDLANANIITLTGKDNTVVNWLQAIKLAPSDNLNTPITLTYTAVTATTLTLTFDATTVTADKTFIISQNTKVAKDTSASPNLAIGFIENTASYKRSFDRYNNEVNQSQELVMAPSYRTETSKDYGIVLEVRDQSTGNLISTSALEPSVKLFSTTAAPIDTITVTVSNASPTTAELVTCTITYLSNGNPVTIDPYLGGKVCISLKDMTV